MNDSEQDGKGVPESAHSPLDGVNVRMLGDPEKTMFPVGEGIPGPGIKFTVAVHVMD